MCKQDAAILHLLLCAGVPAAVAVRSQSRVGSGASAFPAGVWPRCVLGRQTRAAYTLIKPTLGDRFSGPMPKAEFDFVTELV